MQTNGEIVMSIAEEYKAIYHRELKGSSNGVIFLYSPRDNKYSFMPFSHDPESDGVKKLSALMRKNLLFYCFGEEEIVKHYRKQTFHCLEEGAQYVYRNRLPKRQPTQDGLPGEVLLDLLIQLYVRDSHKISVRPILRQDDNNEIKGYDLAYFSMNNDETTLWLGQAKLGEKHYCKKGIHDDLLLKFEETYLSKQLFFICDKQIGVTEESEKLTDIINKVNLATLNENDDSRAAALLRCFNDNNIKINIPCLMAYDQESVYQDHIFIAQRIEEEMEELQKFFIKNEYRFKGFQPRIVFYIFPIKSIKTLRDFKDGFYYGLS